MAFSTRDSDNKNTLSIYSCLYNEIWRPDGGFIRSQSGPSVDPSVCLNLCVKHDDLTCLTQFSNAAACPTDGNVAV